MKNILLLLLCTAALSVNLYIRCSEENKIISNKSSLTIKQKNSSNLDNKNQSKSDDKNKSENKKGDIIEIIPSQSKEELIEKSKIQFYKELFKDSDGKSIRAKGEFEFGEILIKAKEINKVDIIDATSNFGKRGAIATKNDFDVIYKNKNGVEKIITTLKEVDIRQPLNNTIHLQTFKSNDYYIFGFIPEYMSSYGYPLYMFGIDKNEETVQFDFKTKFKNGRILEDDKVNICRRSLDITDNLLKLFTIMQIEETGYPRARSFTVYYKLHLEDKLFELAKYELTYK